MEKLTISSWTMFNSYVSLTEAIDDGPFWSWWISEIRKDMHMMCSTSILLIWANPWAENRCSRFPLCKMCSFFMFSGVYPLTLKQGDRKSISFMCKSFGNGGSTLAGGQYGLQSHLFCACKGGLNLGKDIEFWAWEMRWNEHGSKLLDTCK